MRRIAVTALALASLSLIIFTTGCWEPLCPLGEEPKAIIDKPRLHGWGTQSYGRVVTFAWHCEPDCRPMSIRHFYGTVTDTNGAYSDTFNVVRDLNKNPWRYEERWSRWIPYNAPNNAGRQVTIPYSAGDGGVIGDDDLLEPYKLHVFAVQARSYCDNVTTIFELNVNVRRFYTRNVPGPLLTIWEPLFGRSRFIGTGMNPVACELPPGIPLNFNWEATADDYGGEILCYRYGWDVQDIHDPSDWEVSCHPSIVEAPERIFHSGVHMLYVEAVDNANNTTRGAIQINIITFAMDRNLLWVDDFVAPPTQSPLYEMPSEYNHDAFWLDICSRAEGFMPGRDVYDCYYDHNTEPPAIQEIGRYKNIIWTYSSTQDAWRKIIQFTSEYEVGPAHHEAVNYLALFLVKGGHLWTLGRSEKAGGLAATWRQNNQPLWPATFEHDLAMDPDDESVFDCMGYNDYCVTAIDKIWGSLRTAEDEVPPDYRRGLDRDAMRYAYKDDTDWITGQYPILPDRLDLWEEVTKTGRFFDPRDRGFIYCEIYDPEYYIYFLNLASQVCFHPMYRMKARSSLSFINDQTIAIWVTKYEDIVPEVESGIGVPARSVHFGFPLWFFDRAAVDDIVEVVFNEWQILATP
jgi:hypothetical protein